MVEVLTRAQGPTRCAPALGSVRKGKRGLETPGKRKALPAGPLGSPRWRSADQAARGRPWLSHGKPRLQLRLFFSACPCGCPLPSESRAAGAPHRRHDLRGACARLAHALEGGPERSAAAAAGEHRELRKGARPLWALPAASHSPRHPGHKAGLSRLAPPPVCATLCCRPLTHPGELRAGGAGLCEPSWAAARPAPSPRARSPPSTAPPRQLRRRFPLFAPPARRRPGAAPRPHGAPTFCCRRAMSVGCLALKG